MMLGALDASQEANSTSSSSASSVLGKDDFLRMLVAQLEYQDPLSPTDSTEFSAQLAQFTSLEQLTNLNESFEYLLLYQASLNNSQAMDFLGKTVRAHGDQIEFTDEVPGGIHFELPAEAAELQVRIYDEEGTLVRTLEAGAMAAGEHTMQWDGMDSYGMRSPEGRYRFEVVANDAAGKPVTATTLVQERVKGVVFRNDGAHLQTDAGEIALASVVEVLAG